MSDVPAPDDLRRGEGPRRTPLRSLAQPRPTAERGSAMIVQAVSLTVSGARASVSVEVREQGEQSVGVAEGACAGNALDRLVAEAALRAVAGIEREADLLALDAVAVAPLGTRDVATAVLAAGDTALVGAAAVGAAGRADAVARAVLDAIAHRSASS